MCLFRIVDFLWQYLLVFFFGLLIIQDVSQKDAFALFGCLYCFFVCLAIEIVRMSFSCFPFVVIFEPLWMKFESVVVTGFHLVFFLD